MQISSQVRKITIRKEYKGTIQNIYCIYGIRSVVNLGSYFVFFVSITRLILKEKQ